MRQSRSVRGAGVRRQFVRAAWAAAGTLLAAAPLARAGVTQATNSSVGALLTNQTAFDNQVTSTDLINQGSSTFRLQTSGGTTSTGGNGGSGFDKLNDGLTSSKLTTNSGT